MAERAYTDEASLWHQAGIRPGARVADVGCGPGAVLPALAQAVGRTGRVVGVDADSEAVSSARAYAAACGFDDVEVLVGRAEDTGLGAESQDVVMMRHVLAHNGGREDQIVAHLASRLAPGGSLYVVDADVTGATLTPADPDIADLGDRYVAWHAWRGNDMRAGPHLAGRLRAAGLHVDVDHSMSVTTALGDGVRPPAWAARAALRDAGQATDQDIARWSSAFQRIEASQIRYEGTIPLYVAIGRKGGVR
jgi:SAM-dependent methyltransferase